MAEIPDGVKIFLRSVLVTTPGMPQSQVAREYYETTDERIDYMKYGYRNIYEFLISLQGDVTRLEFSPKHGDNLVYAVLDKTKFASKHAQKYASKTNSGMAPKSPEEILAWKKGHLEKGTLPIMAKKKSGGKGGNRGRTKQWSNPRGSSALSKRLGSVSKPMPMVPKPVVSGNRVPPRSPSPTRSVTAETSASVDEWSLLRQLLPERDNKFTLLVRKVGVSQSGKFNPHELFSHFAAYNIHKEVTYRYEYAHKDVTKRQEWACISFPTLFTAYRAWKEKHNSILKGMSHCRIGVEPGGGSLASLTTPLFKVMVVDMPRNIIMSTFVTKFVRFSALVCVDSRPRESCAIIVYSKEESAQRACTEVTNIKVDGVMVTLNVQPLLEDADVKTLSSDPNADQKLTKLSYNSVVSKEEEKKVCIDFLRNDCFRGSSCIYSHNVERHNEKACSLPRNVCMDFQLGRCSRAICKFLHISKTDAMAYKNTGSLPPHLCLTSKENDNAEQKTVTAGQYADQKAAAAVEPDEKPVTIDINNNMDELISLEGRVCGFCISYQQWFQMFQVTRRKEPKVLYHYPEDIQFLVTHQTEPIRFWAWLMMDGVEKNARKLGAIEKSIAEMVGKVQPPTNLPKAGHRGAALFRDGTNETWYRCYVLSADIEKDEIEVFYCDYGNSEWVQRDLFRSTYNDAWALDPLAVPMKLSGMELKKDVDFSSYTKLSISEVLHGQVVKSSKYSEPHILELKNITYSSNSVCVDNEMTGIWCVSTEELLAKAGTEEEKKQSEVEGEVEGLTTEDNSIEHAEMGAVVENGMDGELASIEVKPEEEDCGELRDNEEDAAENSEGETEEEKAIGVVSSLYDYDEEDLVNGVICQAHHPSLIYLKLGDTSSFNLLQLALDTMKLILPNHIEKDNIMLLCREGGRRRVQVLQVLPAFSKAKVLHVDHGTIEWVDLENLHLLPQDLQDSLFQARPASLAGVDCSGRLERAIAYVQSKLNLLVKVNVITESDEGKVHVELFDIMKGMSINKEMVDTGLGLYSRKDYKACDEFTPSLVAIPVEELEKWRTGLPAPAVQPADLALNQEPQHISSKERTSSAISWHSNTAMSSNDRVSLDDEDDWEQEPQHISPKERTSSAISWHSNTAMPSNDRGSLDDEDDWEEGEGSSDDVFKDLSAISALSLSTLNSEHKQVETSKVNRSTEGNFNHFFQELLDNENNGVAYPAPDIVKSANQFPQHDSSPKELMSKRVDSIQIEGEVIKFDLEKVDPNKRNKMRALWVVQKKKLMEVDRRLSRLLAMPDEDLRNYYSEMKRDKLLQIVSVKEARKYCDKLEQNNDKVIKETNQMLSLI